MRTARMGLLSAGAAATVLGTYNVYGDFPLPTQRQKHLHHKLESPTLPTPLTLTLKAKSLPPPIGCVDWPAGRVLLQWAVDNLPAGNVTIEVGAGIGKTAIGLACANALREIHAVVNHGFAFV